MDGVSYETILPIPARVTTQAHDSRDLFHYMLLS